MLLILLFSGPTDIYIMDEKISGHIMRRIRDSKLVGLDSIQLTDSKNKVKIIFRITEGKVFQNLIQTFCVM